MGKLAMWGAIGGAAEGVQKNIEQTNKEKMMDLDEARTMRILAITQKHQSTMQSTDITAREGMQQTDIDAEKERQKIGIDAQRDQQGAGFEHDVDIQGSEQSFKRVENDKDRASAERIASTRADGSTGKSKRWTSKVTTSTRPGPNGIPEQFDSLVVFDNQDAVTYQQQGDKFVPQGTEPASIRRAPKSAIKNLMENQDTVDDFLEMYNYLPVQYLRAQ